MKKSALNAEVEALRAEVVRLTEANRQLLEYATRLQTTPHLPVGPYVWPYGTWTVTSGTTSGTTPDWARTIGTNHNAVA